MLSFFKNSKGDFIDRLFSNLKTLFILPLFIACITCFFFVFFLENNFHSKMQQRLFEFYKIESVSKSGSEVQFVEEFSAFILKHTDTYKIVVFVMFSSVFVIWYLFFVFILDRFKSSFLERFAGLSEQAKEKETHYLDAIEELSKSVARSDESMKTREEMMRYFYHDLRSPISVILQCSEVLSEEEIDSAGKHSALKILKKNAVYLSEFCNNFLEYIRILNPQYKTVLTASDIRDVAEYAVSTLSALAEEKGVFICYDVREDVPAAVGMNEFLIQQVIYNLGSNAIKYGPKNSKVTVGLSRHESDWLKVSVKDTGNGIAKEDEERIFDEFYRGKSSEESQGFGIGLAFCRKVISIHGGKLWLEENSRKGCTFSFIISLQP